MNNGDEYNNREELKIKDLQIKIQVLKNGIIEERNKKSEIEKDMTKLRVIIENYEKLINEKENIIVTLSKEKYELHSKLEIEKSKSDSSSNFTNILGGIFQRRESLSGFDDKKLISENKEIQFQNELFKKKLEDQTEDFENCKVEYQNLLNIQMAKIKMLESTILEKNKNIDENNKKLEIMFDNYKKYDIEKTKYESEINELSINNKLKEEKIIELLLKLEEKENVLITYKESLMRHEIESSELARKLAELKNAIIESNLVIHKFRGEKLGAIYNTPIEVIFI
jgi:hypothetical protein